MEKTDGMFKDCPQISDFSVDVSSVVSSEGMFENDVRLVSFSSDLPSDTNASKMFNNCKSLVSFTGSLASISSESKDMFSGCTSLVSFVSDLSSFDGCTVGELFSDSKNTLERYEGDLNSLSDEFSVGSFVGFDRLSFFRGNV